MHILATRGGALVAPFLPIGNLASLAVLDSGCPVEYAVVADRDDIDLQALQAAARGFLHRCGWDTDQALADELAEDMAAGATELADQFEPGTRVYVDYDHVIEQWLIAPIS